jgi:hypothetical protein
MTDTTSLLSALFIGLLSQAPMVIVLIVGLVMAARYSSLYPRAAQFVTIAMIVFLVEIFLGSLLTYMIPSWVLSGGMSTSQVSFIYGGIGFLRSLISVVGFALLIAAAFAERSESPS